ncbi:transmembrane protein 121 isoform X2 [Gouania willdenowi]|uniref:Transmembrane protein 121-like n=2 Tax=Gouania willdenowi TaxID=441366 RepID=A0A8C5EUL9_GOUWI|nr:transmembrane protein 121-like isoform X2 [Gouania willdenowi]
MVPTPQVCVSTLVTVSTMAVVDLYLLEQSMLGTRGLSGPTVWQYATVLLGDAGFLLALRFVSAGVMSEARSPHRGFANALWFLFLSLLQLKLFFVCHNYRQERRPPDPLARKTLTLLLSICLPSLFLILTGADHMTPQRRKQEVRGRLLWVVVDLLDVLDLQAGLWEMQGGSAGGMGGVTETKLPIWVEGLVFFYCYALLLLLPCVALTELGATGLPGQKGPRKEALYPWLSLVTINIFTLALRGTGMLWFRDSRVSTVFLGKNLLALMLKLNSAWERHKQERGTVGSGAAAEAEPPATVPSQSLEQNQSQAQGKAPSHHYHTLSCSQSHTLSHISLEPQQLL